MNAGQMFTPEEKVKRAIGRHPDWPNYKVAKTANVRVDAVRSIRAGISPTPQTGELKPLEGNGGAALVSLDKVIARYDIKAAILRVIAELPNGKLIAEAELCQRTAGSDRARFKRCLENNEAAFAVHRIKLRLGEDSEGKYYWGSREDIAAALQIRDL